MAADLTDAQLKHLLRRTEYVARPNRVTYLNGLADRSAVVDDILDVTTPVALDPYMTTNVPDEGWEQYIFSVRWWLNRMAFDAPKPIQEKMAFFWHGHFTSAYYKTNNLAWATAQNALFRNQGLANFKTLTHAMALQPQMLNYLDNDQNTNGSPNQNFARELLELFTLGIGNYQESDVEAAARAWTGYGIGWDENDPSTYQQYVFRPQYHDALSKTFLGRADTYTGPGIIDEILTVNTTAKRIAARFIIGKLWKHFAGSTAPVAVLDELDDPFMATWEIKPLMKAILVHPQFYSAAAMELQVRSPVDWVVAVMVQTGFRCGEDGVPANARYVHPEWYFEGMGQIPFNPPNVAGWKYNDYWANTSTMGMRAEFAGHVANLLRGGGDPYSAWRNLADSLLVANCESLFGLTLSGVSRTAMESYAAAERTGPSPNSWYRLTQSLHLAMLAPEMHVA